MQRLQVGLFGLGSMVLLVGLANIIINAREREEQVVVDPVPADAAPFVVRPPVRDPLADAGVVPDLPSRPTESAEGGQGDVPPPQP